MAREHVSPMGFVYCFRLEHGLERRPQEAKAITSLPVDNLQLSLMTDEELRFVAAVIDRALHALHLKD
jgi:hypothetical protein